MYNLFIFSWNTQSNEYGTVVAPDFLQELYTKIINSNADILVIGLQEDCIRNSTLLNNRVSILCECLKKDYILQELSELSGWGVTTYKALKNDWEYKPRGLRLAVFKKVNSDIVIKGIQVKTMVCPSLRDWITAGKGGICINIITEKGSISFLNIHLPFSSRSIIKTEQRSPALLWQAQCLKELYEQCVEEYSPDCIFILGDLNFRVQITDEIDATDVAKRLFQLDSINYIHNLINNSDELRLLIGYPNSKLPFLEGINNEGPVFLPTCKLSHGRKEISEKSFKCGKLNQRTPSWCDRILYNSVNLSVKCVYYDRMDYGNMNYSDHAAVIGIFSFSNH